MLTVRISEEARAAIDAYCADNGITVTAWVEAVGRRIIELRSSDQSGTPLHEVADDTIAIARRIDAERRARTSDQRGDPTAGTGPP
jgi:hypothetical protein